MGHSESHDIYTALRRSYDHQPDLFKRGNESTDEGGEDDLAWK